MTTSCRDCDPIPKVADAGAVFNRGDRTLQRMHNGLVIEEGCYYGPWMTEIIRELDGHHEPQEEAVFHRIVQALAETAGSPTMIEFGSFWTYYGMWFTSALDDARALAIEPDPTYLDIGRRNAALNDLTDRILFRSGAVGAEPGATMQFTAESDGAVYPIPQFDLASALDELGTDRVDLVLADIQGAETVLLERGRQLLERSAVRFLMVSTHHHEISGSVTTHQDALAVLTDAGAHVIAEHSVSESFSGDGLIAVSFDPRDRDITVPISHARAVESLFGGLEQELQTALDELGECRARVGDLEREIEAASRAQRLSEAPTWAQRIRGRLSR